MTEYVIGRTSLDTYNHKVPVTGRGIIVGRHALAHCGITVRPINNGDALAPWDPADRYACPECEPRGTRPADAITRPDPNYHAPKP